MILILGNLPPFNAGIRLYIIIIAVGLVGPRSLFVVKQKKSD